MAGLKRHTASHEPHDEGSGGKAGEAALNRLAEAAEAQWQDWASEAAGAAEPDGAALVEMVYGISDLRIRAQALGLGFLGYLLGMAYHEALSELRARKSHAYPMPPARK